MEIGEDNDYQPEEVPVDVKTEDMVVANLIELTEDPEKNLFIGLINHAVNDFVGFLTPGHNECNVEEFFSAYSYLFQCRSSNKDTWVNKEAIDTRESRLMCFDVHFELAKVNIQLSEGRFLSQIKKMREAKVEQYLSYMERKIQAQRRKIQPPNPRSLSKSYLYEVLTNPTEESLALLFFV